MVRKYVHSFLEHFTCSKNDGIFLGIMVASAINLKRRFFAPKKSLSDGDADFPFLNEGVVECGKNYVKKSCPRFVLVTLTVCTMMCSINAAIVCVKTYGKTSQ